MFGWYKMGMPAKKKMKTPPLRWCSCKQHYLFQPCPKRRAYPESLLSQMVRERYPDLLPAKGDA